MMQIRIYKLKKNERHLSNASARRWQPEELKPPMSLSFFFSSRRRHTRSLCDWSSDVCSSDLGRDRSPLRRRRTEPTALDEPGQRQDPDAVGSGRGRRVHHRQTLAGGQPERGEHQCRGPSEIGRASCRERGEDWVVVESFEKK